MAIERKCENCQFDSDGLNEICVECLMCNKGASHIVFTPKEELFRQDVINDFKELIENIYFISNFENEHDNTIFDTAVTKFKDLLLDRLGKYEKKKVMKKENICDTCEYNYICKHDLKRGEVCYDYSLDEGLVRKDERNKVIAEIIEDFTNPNYDIAITKEDGSTYSVCVKYLLTHTGIKENKIIISN